MSYIPGDRVRLIFTIDKYTGLKSGDKGTVEDTVIGNNFIRIWIRWDSGSFLSMLPLGGDRIEVIDN